MAERPFTVEWGRAFQQIINTSDAYRVAGAAWVWPLALVLDATPELGYPNALALRADLRNGTCVSMHLVSADEVDAPFVLRGSYANWKALMADGLDPVMAIVRGRLRLTGSLATIIRHVNAARALVDCARAVPTTFPDEPAPGT